MPMCVYNVSLSIETKLYQKWVIISSTLFTAMLGIRGGAVVRLELQSVYSCNLKTWWASTCQTSKMQDFVIAMARLAMFDWENLLRKGRTFLVFLGMTIDTPDDDGDVE